MVDQLAILSENTPIFSHVGQKLKPKDVDELRTLADSITKANNVEQGGGGKVTVQVDDLASTWAKKNGTTTVSLAALNQLADLQGEINGHEFQNHIMEYVEEWDAVVTTRIDQILKDTKKLQLDRTHYEDKVDKLRNTVNELETKGKTTPTGTADKLARNEEKLKEAWEAHETSAAKSCLLIEEATQRGWKELYHVVKNLMKWETNRVGRANDIYANVPDALDSMKATLQQSGKKSTKKKKKTPGAATG
jgi:hypothetical protein